MPRYSHLSVQNTTQTADYTARRGRSPEFRIADRPQRGTHADRLQGQLTQAATTHREAFPVQVGNAFFQDPGITITFESEPEFPLAFESLDLKPSKIELLNVQTTELGQTIATVHIPDDKIQIFLNRIEAYRRDGKRNRKLLANIASIRLATLRELWTDSPDLYPEANQSITWEVWVRGGKPPEGDDPATQAVHQGLESLMASAEAVGYSVASQPLFFVDRTVILIRGTREQLSTASTVLGVIAEVRRAKETADFFDKLPVQEQAQWIQSLLQRLTPADANAPAVGLLDTGVTRGHPLLAPIISNAQAQALKPSWGPHDTHPGGHGTPMAGLAIYGDLAPILAGNGPVVLTHGLESLKLFNHADQHEKELYGLVTIEGVNRLETLPPRKRVYCMAISTDGRDKGRPTSWSAALDQLASGAIDDVRRLILVSAGNVDLADRGGYPDINELTPLHDPGQAWNVLTVGGFTEKVQIDPTTSPGWTPLAAFGDLAPSSTTSLPWIKQPKPPVKPDIVMEAANMASHPTDEHSPDHKSELMLLSTNYRFEIGHRPFTTMYDTSAATALAANLAATLAARYPEYTPETLRGLLVHSARWTDAMRARATVAGTLDTVRLVRMFGFGVPRTRDVLTSANHALTMIAEGELHPFHKPQGSSAPKSKDINYHRLPWPADVLTGLPLNTPVTLRVTLSYFVEPSPGERGWDKKYGYASHGLRFQIIRPLESVEDFETRVNKHMRDDEHENDSPDEEGAWIFGSRPPSNGSLHINEWHGTSQQLASRSLFAVYPTRGWWRDRPGEKRFDRQVPYSLIVSIITPDETIDIYTPVANAIGVQTPVPVEVEI